MCKLSVCLVLAIFGCLVGHSLAGVTRNEPEHREIILVKDVHEFASKHPGLKMQRMEKQPTLRAAGQAVRYTLGSRISGDRLVAQNADVYDYTSVNDVSVQLTYPESGMGSIVNFVEIICTQDNKDGNAYVIAGGIGQRFISIVIEAKQTKNFAYQSQFYGSD